ncbi:MAG TPA: hypothetical protein VF337_04990 [Candidatus Limnocylindrales bacterium]
MLRPRLAYLWRFLGHPAGPAVVAAAFALLSLPLVALSLDSVSTAGSMYEPNGPIRLRLIDPGRWLGAFGSVMAASLVAGAVCGPLVRKHAKIGVFVTVVLAWEVAIAALPVLPALFGMNVGFEYYCYNDCQAAIAANNPEGVLFVLGLPWTPLFEPVPALALTAGVAVWAGLLRHSAGINRVEGRPDSDDSVNE